MVPPPPKGTRVRLKTDYRDWARSAFIPKGSRGYVLGAQTENGNNVLGNKYEDGTFRIGVDMNLPGTRKEGEPRVPGIVVTAAKFFDLFELSPDESVPPAPPIRSVWERLMDDE